MAHFQFVEGTQEVLGGFVTLRACEPKSFLMDRIEVPESLRRNGRMDGIIAFLVTECDRQGVELSAMISPDERGIEGDAIAEGMLRVFNRHGFDPLEMDGEIYRMDVNYTPKDANQS